MARAKVAEKEEGPLSEVVLNFEEIPPVDQETHERIKAQAVRDIFGPGANPKKRYVNTYQQAAQYSVFLKGLGLEVVYTAGVWDLPHIGHARYLQQAKQRGDILIVGVELDKAVSIRKGPKRPVIPFNERVEMLCHIRHVDLVVPIPDFDERGLSGMKMVQAIQPDTFIATQRSFKEASDTEQWIRRVQKFCNRVEILESQAETSTSNKIRDLVIGYGDLLKIGLKDTKQAVMSALTEAWEEMERNIDETTRKM